MTNYEPVHKDILLGAATLTATVALFYGIGFISKWLSITSPSSFTGMVVSGVLTTVLALVVVLGLFFCVVALGVLGMGVRFVVIDHKT
jgi:hypothetical protein